jgi:hypothetical protein
MTAICITAQYTRKKDFFGHGKTLRAMRGKYRMTRKVIHLPPADRGRDGLNRISLQVTWSGWQLHQYRQS